VKIAFDTSVVIAGSLVGHVHAERASVWLDAARQRRFDARVTSHGLAEAWATLSALPIEPRLAPATVLRLVERFQQHVAVLELTWDDYRRAIERCADRGLRSGAVYDALHLVAAERWDADVMLTFNVRHFERLSASERPRIAAPPDPPGLEAILEHP
jgi:predicted nucleic acid-binding protein